MIVQMLFLEYCKLGQLLSTSEPIKKVFGQFVCLRLGLEDTQAEPEAVPTMNQMEASQD